MICDFASQNTQAHTHVRTQKTVRKAHTKANLLRRQLAWTVTDSPPHSGPVVSRQWGYTMAKAFVCVCVCVCGGKQARKSVSVSRDGTMRIAFCFISLFVIFLVQTFHQSKRAHTTLSRDYRADCCPAGTALCRPIRGAYLYCFRMYGARTITIPVRFLPLSISVRCKVLPPAVPARTAVMMTRMMMMIDEPVCHATQKRHRRRTRCYDSIVQHNIGCECSD